MLQVFFHFTDLDGNTHQTNPKPYEFDEAAVYALFNSSEVCYPLTMRDEESGKVTIGKMTTVENVVFDLFHEIPVLRIHLQETRS
ncbi:hypothetical protein H8B09_06790 [Paenibacillus sp. PR3]|uniref:Uncharacterized protein n=1 Tax=Paenibacillus terricola TaxID=2763503 RepID=A0ABR8MTP6_9BACL|nr:hypothetical protein [Paenibacillus terricola]MBD3918456.1 hypothetical protein [Paenibacillus terricola]